MLVKSNLFFYLVIGLTMVFPLDYRQKLEKLCRLNISKLLLLLVPMQAFGSWYDQKLEGWYYFEEKEALENQPVTTPEEAEEKVSLESQKLHQLLSLALLSPTPEHVETYIRAQKRWISQSNRFAQTWGKTLLEHPELSDLPITPTSSYGILAKRSHDLTKRKELLQTLSNEFFILLFFKGADPLSEKAAEALLAFASTNQWKYKAVSLDNEGLSTLSNFEIDKGLSQNLKVQISPSFFIVNPKESLIYPIGAGLLAVSELEQNIEMHFEANPEPVLNP